jgi:hypothetical protein
MARLMSEKINAIALTEHFRSGGETGAGVMRNRCAFTSRDMGDDWPEAFTYAVVCGWDGDSEGDSAMEAMAAKFGWDEPLIEFLRDAHRRFEALADRTKPRPW